MPVFGDEDQMDMHVINTVPPLANIGCLIHVDQV